MDLAAVDPTVRVDPAEHGVHGRRDLVVARRGRSGQRHRGADGDGRRGHPRGALRARGRRQQRDPQHQRRSQPATRARAHRAGTRIVFLDRSLASLLLFAFLLADCSLVTCRGRDGVGAAAAAPPGRGGDWPHSQRSPPWMPLGADHHRHDQHHAEDDRGEVGVGPAAEVEVGRTARSTTGAGTPGGSRPTPCRSASPCRRAPWPPAAGSTSVSGNSPVFTTPVESPSSAPPRPAHAALMAKAMTLVRATWIPASDAAISSSRTARKARP